MLRAWLLFLHTFIHLQINLVGAVAIGPKLINLSFDTYSVPLPIRSSHPLGLSFEFFAFPSYLTEVLQTNQCLLNLELAYGVAPAVRIGGTTQDRAVYDPNETQPIRYSLPPGEQVPKTISFGPQFIELASRLKGPTTIGFSRQLGDLKNVGLAALTAVQKMNNLYAIELGNEPEFWGPRSPEAHGNPWTPEADSNSQIRWQQAISEKVFKRGIIQAGVFLSPPRWSVQELAPKEEKGLEYVRSFGGHAYPQSACGDSKTSLPDLMNHSRIVSFVKHYEPEVLAARKVQKPYHFSESNSATCGGHGISATFGAALWLMDYVFQSLILGVDRVYFHQGTINHSPYSFWNQTQVSPTYYGAYFTTLALRETTHISTMETSNPAVAVYALWRCQRIARLVVYHSEFHDGAAAAELSPDIVRIEKLPSDVRKARVLRLSAKHAFIGEGGPGLGQVRIGGGYFDNDTCKISVLPKYETVSSNLDRLEILIHKSEAMILELDRQIPSSC
ncbi:hypothetical protein PSTG_03599 [Puccinia striiformis f. sp. tritici PST-78]|uniref:Beta-glucuronidase C-terminal domain-containing protein n=1 Tax=Puccinia striiformis f. sp. tritici PST-78 TaxID=1165861 RepID=A0A0L0VVN2_9BASI|nr:hypothetical protein PSTG_03599 [Puccinia striiformis f. sp. tritici PST-78]